MLAYELGMLGIRIVKVGGPWRTYGSRTLGVGVCANDSTVPVNTSQWNLQQEQNTNSMLRLNLIGGNASYFCYSLS